MMFAENLLSGKRVLITGGGSGLGRAMALKFASLGASLALVGRRSEVLLKTAEEIKTYSVEVKTYVLDQRNAEDVERVFAEIFSAGKVDVLVNNAAANFVAQSHKLSSRAADAILSTSLNGALYCTLAAGRHWIAAGDSAVVLSIVTSYAWHGSPFVVPSAMAKAGVLAMTRSLASEWGPHGIRFVAIAPGSFPTPGAWERLVPREELANVHETSNSIGRPGQPEELADLAAFLVSDNAGYIHGECVTIDGGRWLKGAGTFGFMDSLSDKEWADLRTGNSGGNSSEDNSSGDSRKQDLSKSTDNNS